MKADENVEKAVKAVMNQFADAYQTKDWDLLRACFASDPDVVLYGTGADEKRIGLEQIKSQAERDWSQAETGSVTYNWTSVSAAGPVAWAAADGTFNMTVDGQEISFPMRLTVVLENRTNRWEIVQSHFSLPAAGQEEGSSVPG